MVTDADVIRDKAIIEITKSLIKISNTLDKIERHLELIADLEMGKERK